MLNNENLKNSRMKKNNEFYTRRVDIDATLYKFEHLFRDKIIYLPCDTVKEGSFAPVSEFVKYFIDNRDRLGIKELVATSLLREGYIVENMLDMYKGEDGEWEMHYSYSTPDKDHYSGDMFSDYCKNIALQADIVITNPPFSQSVNYVRFLLDNDIDFVIIGNINMYCNSMLVNDFFEDKFHTTTTLRMLFNSAEGEVSETATWYTNMPIYATPKYKLRYLPTVEELRQQGVSYDKYNEVDAYEIGAVRWLPRDLDGVYGVPVTTVILIDMINDFELVDIREFLPHLKYAVHTGGLTVPCHGVGGNRAVFKRVLIRRRQ